MTTTQVLPSFIIGVAGGSGSGKTTVSGQIRAMVGVDQLAYLQHDSYYRDTPHLALDERAQINYDHPDSLETSLLVEHLQALRQGQPIEVPSYDFGIYARQPTTRTVHPARIILVDGMLIFVEKTLRELMDMRIFVDTDSDLRFIRRLRRDPHAR